MVHDLTEDNLTRYIFCVQDSWRDLLQEYLDSLVSSDLFEPMQENNSEDSRIDRAIAGTTESTNTSNKNSQSHPHIDNPAGPSTRSNKRSPRRRRSKQKALSTTPAVDPEENSLVQPPHSQPAPPNFNAKAIPEVKGRIQHTHSRGGEKAISKENLKVEMTGRRESNRKDTIGLNSTQSRPDVGGIKPSRADNNKATNLLAGYDQSGKDSQNDNDDNENPPQSRRRDRRRRRRRPRQLGQEEAPRPQRPQDDPTSQ